MTNPYGWLPEVGDGILESPNTYSTPQQPLASPHSHQEYLEAQFDGTRVAPGETVSCLHCGECLHEGRPVTARAYRYSDESTHTVAAVSCAGCAPSDLTRTAHGRNDVLLEADLGIAMAGQIHWTILVEPTVVATA